MAVISPTSGNHNYNIISDKTNAPFHLLCKLNEGRHSGKEEGYISSDDVKAYFYCKKLQSTELRHIGGKEL